HEILGIRADADEAEVLRAYKEAIKRFHPDTIQGPAKDQLEFYQKASAAINNAKNLMIKNLRSR
ncbi:J domain-containing protein, partial [bacterium]|nr:J domain-containing protein [bacterium]